MKKRKNGFTLVELLVVIAILAILATVTVVGYSSFTKKAQISNDISVVTQLNNILQANEQLEEKPKTMTEVFDILDDAGYDITKLTPTADKHEFVWNEKTNRIIITDDSYHPTFPEDAVINSENKINHWAIVDEYNSELGMSQYLRGNKLIGDININTSIDVGFNKSIDNINYTNASDNKNIVIRTASSYTHLNVNDSSEAGVVTHYGPAGRVVIEKCANNSYHEKGSVAYVEIQQGHLVVEKQAEVKIVHPKPAEAVKAGELVIDVKVEESAPVENKPKIVVTEISEKVVVKNSSNNEVELTPEENVKEQQAIDSLVKQEVEKAQDNEIKTDPVEENIVIANATNGKKYESIDALIADLENVEVEQRLVLLDNIQVTKTIPVSFSLSIDLNGHTIQNKVENDALFNLYNTGSNISLNLIGSKENSQITIPDSNTKSLGIINMAKNTSASIKNTAIIGNTGLKEVNDENYRVGLINFDYGNTESDVNASLRLEEVSARTNSYIINDAPGLGFIQENSIIVDNCSFSTESIAMFMWDGSAKMVMNNTTIVANRGPALELYAGTYNINNCNVRVNYETNPEWLNAAIAVCSKAKVTIDGGTYTSTLGTALHNYGSQSVNQVVVVKNGTFKGKQSIQADNGDIYVVNGEFDGAFKVQAAGKIHLFGGSYTHDVASYKDAGSISTYDSEATLYKYTLNISSDYTLKQATNSGKLYLFKKADLNEQGKLVSGKYPLLPASDALELIDSKKKQDSNGNIIDLPKAVNVHVSTEQELRNAIRACIPGSTNKIYLDNDINVTSAPGESALELLGVIVEIHLNGYNIVNTQKYGNVFLMDSGAKLYLINDSLEKYSTIKGNNGIDLNVGEVDIKGKVDFTGCLAYDICAYPDKQFKVTADTIAKFKSSQTVTNDGFTSSTVDDRIVITN